LMLRTTLRWDLSSGTGLPETLDGLLPMMTKGEVGVGGKGSRESVGTCVRVASSSERD
jgi:hypothetical protein